MSTVRTPIGVLSFPTLFAARPAVTGGEPRFSLNLILDKKAQATPEYAQLRAAVAACLDEKWGTGKSRDPEFIRRAKIRTPFRPCSDREQMGYDVDGGVFIAPWSKSKPGLIGPDQEDILVASDVWSGQLARCSVHPFAYDTQGNKGISLSLGNVQIVKFAMPRLDGRKSAKEEFDRYADADAEMGDSSVLASAEPPF